MQGRKALVYFGTATGIYASSLSYATGELSEPRHVADTPNAGFLAHEPTTLTLYATHRVRPEALQAPYGSVNAFRIDSSTGDLTFINGQSVAATDFVHISTDPKRRVLLAASYGDTRIACFPLAKDGSLGPVRFRHTFTHAGTGANKVRQDKPYPHSIYFDRSSEHVYVCDLGGDKVFTYGFNEKDVSLFAPAEPFVKLAPGAGPRHAAQHPNGRFLYVINELNSTLTMFEVVAGRLSEIQTLSTLPEEFRGDNTTAEVAVSPDGRFLYGSNRGHDSIVSYRVNEVTGRLEYIGWTSSGGEHPRHFCVGPAGHFLIVANRDSDNVVMFKRDLQTGKLTATGQEFALAKCICVKMVSLTA